MSYFTEKTATSVQSIVIGNLALSIVMSTSLQYLWGMINVLQIISHFPLCQITFPLNAQLFYQMIISISQFNIIPTAVIDNALFRFDDSDEGLTQNFNDFDIFPTF